MRKTKLKTRTLLVKQFEYRRWTIDYYGYWYKTGVTDNYGRGGSQYRTLSEAVAACDAADAIYFDDRKLEENATTVTVELSKPKDQGPK